MVHVYTPEFVLLDDWADFLLDHEANVYSQFGEDGLIEALFERIGTENRWCFECGASDGVLYSNTKVLREAGWSAVLIEASDKLVVDLTETAKTETNSKVVGMEISSDTPLDEVLEYAGAPYDMDFGVIDIDGQDYWIWRDMMVFTPRVMLVEYALRNLDPFVYGRGGKGQSGRAAIVELGESKGYRALAATPCNVLFVREDVIKDCDAGQ